MREDLANLDGERMRFRAVVKRFGEKSAYRGYPIPTILLKNVRRTDTNELVTDHLWFTRGKSWADVKEGDAIEFDARVASYAKGYVNQRQGIDDRTSDYKLTRPTKISIITRKS